MTLVEQQFSSPDGEACDIEEFYRATKKRMLDTALRLAGGDLHLANDATQLAYVEMLRVWPQRQHLTIEANRRYATKIAANKIADRFRCWRDLPFPDGDVVDADFFQRELATVDASLDAVHDAVDGCRPEYRMLLDVVDEQPPVGAENSSEPVTWPSVSEPDRLARVV